MTQFAGQNPFGPGVEAVRGQVVRHIRHDQPQAQPQQQQPAIAPQTGLRPEQYEALLQALTGIHQQAVGAQEAGIDAASGVHDFAREEAARRGQQQMAETQQQAIQRGLGTTTILPALQRGVQEDVARDMRGIAAQEGQMLAGLHGQLAGTMMQGGQMLGQAIAQPVAGRWRQLQFGSSGRVQDPGPLNQLPDFQGLVGAL